MTDILGIHMPTDQTETPLRCGVLFGWHVRPNGALASYFKMTTYQRKATIDSIEPT